MIKDVADDSEKLRNFKKQGYNLAYIDSLAYSSNYLEILKLAYPVFHSIFSPYQFDLQTFFTNYKELQSHIDQENEPTLSIAKLFGLLWDRVNDYFDS